MQVLVCLTTCYCLTKKHKIGLSLISSRFFLYHADYVQITGFESQRVVQSPTTGRVVRSRYNPSCRLQYRDRENAMAINISKQKTNRKKTRAFSSFLTDFPVISEKIAV